MRTTTLVTILLLAIHLTACESSTPQESAELPESTEATTDHPQAEAEAEAAAEEEEEELELATDLTPGETRHFGAPFTIEDDPVVLHDLLAEIADEEDFESVDPVKVSAKIHQVCQNRGCWFTLATDAVDVPVRVRMKDYGFFVSRNSDGADAIVEGTLARTTISQDMAQHYADDLAAATGGEAEQVDGPQDSFEFTATAIAMTQPES